MSWILVKNQSQKQTKLLTSLLHTIGWTVANAPATYVKRYIAMKKIILIFTFFSVSFGVNASKCGAPLTIENIGSSEVSLDICLEHNVEKLEKCNYPKNFKIAAGDSLSTHLVFFCGYASDPPLEKHWILYNAGNKYMKARYTNNIVLEIK